jgi:hypothetical protein
MPMTRGTTVWSLVDRTRTRIGRELLRERLLAPPHAAEEILAFQRAHQVLAAEASAYRTTLDRADLDGVERYLSVNWQLPSDMPPLIRVRKWCRQYLKDVQRGQTCVTALLAAATDLRNRLPAADAAILQDLEWPFPITGRPSPSSTSHFAARTCMTRPRPRWRSSRDWRRTPRRWLWWRHTLERLFLRSVMIRESRFSILPPMLRPISRGSTIGFARASPRSASA